MAPWIPFAALEHVEGDRRLSLSVSGSYRGRRPGLVLDVPKGNARRPGRHAGDPGRSAGRARAAAAHGGRGDGRPGEGARGRHDRARRDRDPLASGARRRLDPGDPRATQAADATPSLADRLASGWKAAGEPQGPRGQEARSRGRARHAGGHLRRDPPGGAGGPRDEAGHGPGRRGPGRFLRFPLDGAVAPPVAQGGPVRRARRERGRRRRVEGPRGARRPQRQRAAPAGGRPARARRAPPRGALLLRPRAAPGAHPRGARRGPLRDRRGRRHGRPRQRRLRSARRPDDDPRRAHLRRPLLPAAGGRHRGRSSRAHRFSAGGEFPSSRPLSAARARGSQP